ncbi:hypothetical protein LINPERHAP2_LOCUS25487 [Linum perenne]
MGCCSESPAGKFGVLGMRGFSRMHLLWLLASRSGRLTGPGLSSAPLKRIVIFWGSAELGRWWMWLGIRDLRIGLLVTPMDRRIRLQGRLQLVV